MPLRTPRPLAALAPLALALAACTAPPGPAAAPPPSPAKPAPAEPPSPAEAPSKPAAKPSPFHLVAKFETDVALAPLKGRPLVLAGSAVLDIDGDDIALDAKKQAGLEQYQNGVMGQLVAAGGAWPEAAWLATVEAFGRGGTSVLYRWERSRWVARRNRYGNSTLVGFAPWSQGRTLALVSAQMSSDGRFDVVAGPPARPPKLARSKIPNAPWCSTRVHPLSFSALGSGEVYMLGEVCSEDGSNQGWAVERWPAGGGASTVDELRDLPRGGGIVALAPDEIYVGGSEESGGAILLRFDGKAWAKAPPPGDGKGELNHLSVGPDGALYSLVNGEVWARPRGGAWARVELPEAAGGEPDWEAEQLWARGEGDLWVVAKHPSKDGGGPRALLHTRPPTRTFEMPDRGPQEGSPDELAEAPGPPSPSCKTPFVLLYTLAQRAPEDFDYPATRAALKGHTEFRSKATFVEFARGRQRMLGARVPDFTTGKALAKVVKAHVASSTPQLACHDPKPLRTLKIDLATGALAKLGGGRPPAARPAASTQGVNDAVSDAPLNAV